MADVEPSHRPTLDAGALAVFHLVNPNEKLWGVLERLDAAGVTLRGINLSSFDDWMRQVAKAEVEAPLLGLATMFVPLFRIERIFLDETVGGVMSYRQRFEEHVGRSVESEMLR